VELGVAIADLSNIKLDPQQLNVTKRSGLFFIQTVNVIYARLALCSVFMHLNL